MSPSLYVIRNPGVVRAWAWARWSAFAAVPLLLTWLIRDPEWSLRVLWYVIIPVLPATFFINPRIWRGICPLATLNELGNRPAGSQPLDARLGFLLSVIGLALFHLMVPARHFLFNQNGMALAISIVAIGGLAMLLGSMFAVRSAFCNALCPVLPIEQLYGQQPLLRMTRGRCLTCTLCLKTGCLDLTEKVIPRILGPSRRSARWLLTPHGAFFAALPGFIIGYNQVGDGTLASAGAVYVTTLGWSLASYVVTVAAVLGLRLSSRLVLILAAALAGGLYYWFAGPSIATALGLSPVTGTVIRAGGLGLVMLWLLRAQPGGTFEASPTRVTFNRRKFLKVTEGGEDRDEAPVPDLCAGRNVRPGTCPQGPSRGAGTRSVRNAAGPSPP